MKIIVGENAGFCYGVKRAVDGAKQEIQNKKNEKIYCLGEIVHNKYVVKSLEEKGIEFIEDIKEAKGITIIRAHGVEKNIYELAKQNEIELIDYTCPKVLKIHEIVEKYANRGFFIILTGSQKHPENIGTISFCGDNYCVIENEEMIEEAIEKFNRTEIQNILLISQTTFSMEKFANIQKILQDRLPENIGLIVKNTICPATRIRQEEVSKIAQDVDKMIIIGGKNSSNTKKLFELAKKYCDKSYSVENDKELDLNLFDNNDTIGIMAGASTPQESIDEIVKKLNQI